MVGPMKTGFAREPPDLLLIVEPRKERRMNPYHALGCHVAPFGSRPDAFFEADSHAEALATLRLALHAGWPAARVIGDAGLGKTLLAELLAAEAAPIAHTAILAGANCAVDATQVCAKLPEDTEWRRMSLTVWARARRAGMRGLLIIDDADLLSKASWDALRACAATPAGALTLAILGCDEERARTSDADAMRAILARVRRVARLTPFSTDETQAYIAFRLAQAGARRARFDDAAAALVHRLSTGVPRVIDHICDNALFEAMADQRSFVSARDVEAGARAVGLVSAVAPTAPARGKSRLALAPVRPANVSDEAAAEALVSLERRLSAALTAVRAERARVAVDRRARLLTTGSIRLGGPVDRVAPTGDWWVNQAESAALNDLVRG